jgi:hypothetical protein
VSLLTRSRLLPALVPIVLLAACGDRAGDDAGAASGEVLEGTISDSMLPLDTVRSQPPLAQPEAAGRTSARADEDADETPEGETTQAVGEDGGAAPAGEATPAAAAD